MMLECYLNADVPPAIEIENEELFPETPQGILAMLEKATNEQRSGWWVESYAIAEAAMMKALEGGIPEIEDTYEEIPDYAFGREDDTAQIRIRTVGLLPDEQDPCAQVM
jgi:hypothetical protein